MRVAIKHAHVYQSLLCNHNSEALATIEDLAKQMNSLRLIFAPEAAEADAIRDASGFVLPDGVLDRDRDLLYQLGSLNAVIKHHADKHKLLGINKDRVIQYLSNDPNFNKLLEIADTGGEVDYDDDFVPFRRTAPFRNLQ